MGRRIVICLMLATLLVAGSARAEERACNVRYLSNDHVYLDRGAAAGVTVGMRANVVRGGESVAELEVVYAAENSASCRVVGRSGEIVVGDRVVYEALTEAVADSVVTAPTRTRTTAERRVRTSRGESVALRGRVAVQWDHAQESADRSLETDYLRLPFRLRVTGLGSGLEFRTRGSLRHISRTGFSGTTAADEWRNRILEASLVREGRDLGWQFALGRVGGRRTASAGPFDGLEVTRRLGTGLTWGVFGGFAPAWGDLGFSSEDHLAGTVVHWNRRGDTGRILDVRLAAIGRYRGGEISREYVSLVTTWRDGRRLSLLQAAEVDVHRGWRKEADGNSMKLTSGALSARYQLTDQVTANLGYDNREPVRTWETRSLPDSLFTDAGRNGWRGGVDYRHGSGVFVGASGGIRFEEGSDAETKSWSGVVRVPQRTLGWAGLTARIRGFDGPWLSGMSPSVRVSRRAGSGWRMHVEGGRFAYHGKVADETRTNTWAELGAGASLATHWELTASARQDWGDDIDGRRWFVELARRF